MSRNRSGVDEADGESWVEPGYGLARADGADGGAEGFEGDASALAFPPDLVSDSEGFAFLGRLALLGAGAGVLAALVSFSLSWWFALGVFCAWLVGMVLAGCLAAWRAKKHRAGVGYPADGEAWLRSFSFTLPFVAALIGALSVIAAVVTAMVLAPKAPDYTPAILLAILTALVVAGVRVVSRARAVWLVYGSR